MEVQFVFPVAGILKHGGYPLKNCLHRYARGWRAKGGAVPTLVSVDR